MVTTSASRCRHFRRWSATREPRRSLWRRKPRSVLVARARTTGSTDHIQMRDEHLFRESDSEQRTLDWYSPHARARPLQRTREKAQPTIRQTLRGRRILHGGAVCRALQRIPLRRAWHHRPAAGRSRALHWPLAPRDEGRQARGVFCCRCGISGSPLPPGPVLRWPDATLEPVFRYLTHPQARIDREIPVPEWQLSDLGRARVQALARSGWLRGTKHMIASAAKATETAEIFATSLGIEFKVRPGMHDYRTIDRRRVLGVRGIRGDRRPILCASDEERSRLGDRRACPGAHRHGGRGRPIRPRRRRRYSLCRPWSCGNFALLSLCETSRSTRRRASPQGCHSRWCDATRVARSDQSDARDGWWPGCPT